MKLNHLHLLEGGIKRIATVTDTDTAEIIEALTGVAWDEEDAVSIREFMIDALADEPRRGEKPTYPHPLDIGTHLCKALADGRYDNKVPYWEKRQHQLSPTDVPPKGMLFGGQIPMDDSANAKAEP